MSVYLIGMHFIGVYLLQGEVTICVRNYPAREFA
jgi:hypothetical protein